MLFNAYPQLENKKKWHDDKGGGYLDFRTFADNRRAKKQRKQNN